MQNATLAVFYLYAFAQANLFELPIVYLIACKGLKKPARKSLLTGFLCQLTTHPLLMGALFFAIYFMGEDAPRWMVLLNNIFLKELLIVPLIEAAIYAKLLKPLKVSHALLISYASNLFSWGFGYVFNQLVGTEWILECMLGLNKILH